MSVNKNNTHQDCEFKPYKVKIEIQSAFHLVMTDLTSCDAYIVLEFNKKEFGRTKVIHRNRCPVWNESFEIPLMYLDSNIILRLFDHNNTSEDTLEGYINIPLKSLHFNQSNIFRTPVSYTVKQNQSNMSSMLTPSKSKAEIQYSVTLQKNSNLFVVSRATGTSSTSITTAIPHNNNNNNNTNNNTTTTGNEQSNTDSDDTLTSNRDGESESTGDDDGDRDEDDSPAGKFLHSADIINDVRTLYPLPLEYECTHTHTHPAGQGHGQGPSAGNHQGQSYSGSGGEGVLTDNDNDSGRRRVMVDVPYLGLCRSTHITLNTGGGSSAIAPFVCPTSSSPSANGDGDGAGGYPVMLETLSESITIVFTSKIAMLICNCICTISITENILQLAPDVDVDVGVAASKCCFSLKNLKSILVGYDYSPPISRVLQLEVDAQLEPIYRKIAKNIPLPRQMLLKSPCHMAEDITPVEVAQTTLEALLEHPIATSGQEAISSLLQAFSLGDNNNNSNSSINRSNNSNKNNGDGNNNNKSSSKKSSSHKNNKNSNSTKNTNNIITTDNINNNNVLSSSSSSSTTNTSTTNISTMTNNHSHTSPTSYIYIGLTEDETVEAVAKRQGVLLLSYVDKQLFAYQDLAFEVEVEEVEYTSILQGQPRHKGIDENEIFVRASYASANGHILSSNSSSILETLSEGVGLGLSNTPLPCPRWRATLHLKSSINLKFAEYIRLDFSSDKIVTLPDETEILASDVCTPTSTSTSAYTPTYTGYDIFNKDIEHFCSNTPDEVHMTVNMLHCNEYNSRWPAECRPVMESSTSGRLEKNSVVERVRVSFSSAGLVINMDTWDPAGRDTIHIYNINNNNNTINSNINSIKAMTMSIPDKILNTKPDAKTEPVSMEMFVIGCDAINAYKLLQHRKHMDPYRLLVQQCIQFNCNINDNATLNFNTYTSDSIPSSISTYGIHNSDINTIWNSMCIIHNKITDFRNKTSTSSHISPSGIGYSQVEDRLREYFNILCSIMLKFKLDDSIDNTPTIHPYEHMLNLSLNLNLMIEKDIQRINQDTDGNRGRSLDGLMVTESDVNVLIKKSNMLMDCYMYKIRIICTYFLQFDDFYKNNNSTHNKKRNRKNNSNKNNATTSINNNTNTDRESSTAAGDSSSQSLSLLQSGDIGGIGGNGVEMCVQCMIESYFTAIVCVFAPLTASVEQYLLVP
eukprot:gene9919-20628_t